ncbi:MAG TPA: response regulator transcription factor [Mycobacteriales bacterium]|nr:response regulator transcription factor [Mycobacteriales bacterium]
MNVRVMLVDDTEHVRTMLAEMLSLDGFDVVASCASADEAVDAVSAADPHVVITDLRMPGADGLSCTRRIKALRPAQAVVLYTAYLDDSIEESAREAGVTLCLSKVAGLPELERELSRLAFELTDTAEPA